MDPETVLTQAGLTFTDLRTIPQSPAVLALTIPGESALACWEELCRSVSETKRWPLLTGRRQTFTVGTVFPSMVVSFPDEERSQEYIREGLALDCDAWLVQKQKEYREFIEEEDEDWDMQPLDFEEELHELHGDWPKDDVPPIQIGIHEEPESGVPYAELEMILVPTERCWEVPALLGFGGWNECPSPLEQVAFFKRWHERFGAEVVGIGGDIVEMKVARRPQSRNEAEALAWEQYWYCEDIVDQGVRTIRRLAATLLKSDAWYFWWD